MSQPTYHRHKRTRFWAVKDTDGSLLAVVVYKKGAQAITARLAGRDRYRLTDAGRQALAEAEKAAKR